MAAFRKPNPMMQRTEEFVSEFASVPVDDHVDDLIDRVEKLEDIFEQVRADIRDILMEMHPVGEVFNENTQQSEWDNGFLISTADDENLDGGDGGVEKSFSISISGATATVRAGTIRMMNSNEAIAEDTLTLIGSDPYIYVYEYVDHSTRGFAFSGTDPVSDATRWVWVLAKTTESGGSYTIDDGNLFHSGDVYAQWILK